MTRTTKSLEELQALGDSLLQQLDAGLTPEWDVLERPYPLALGLKARNQSRTDVRSIELESMVDAYLGLLLAERVPGYRKLHADLHARGFTSPEDAFEFGNDAYVWAVEPREVKPSESESSLMSKLLGRQPSRSPTQVLAIGLMTQSYQFLVVLNERFGRWKVHARQYWLDLREEQQSGYLLNLEDIQDRKDLTVEDVVARQDAADRYSDALPGASYFSRPSLATLLEGNLVADDEGAGPSLRHGDSRDLGYVFSLSLATGGNPRAQDVMVSGTYSRTSYVMFNLGCAIDMLPSEDDTQA